jgi:hypothetical protein
VRGPGYSGKRAFESGGWQEALARLAYGFQSIFAWKSLPEAGFGKNVVIDANRCSGCGLTWIIVTRGGLLFKTAVQTIVSNACISHCASVRRASGVVLTGQAEVIPR